VLSGGAAYIYSGANASAVDLSGGTLIVSSGGVLGGGLAIEAGSAVVAGAVSAGQSVSFTGASGVLTLDDPAGFDAKISGLSQPGQKVDLAGFGYDSATETVSWTQTGTSGTLTVRDGAQTASLSLIGAYVGGDFSLASDDHGGSYVSDPHPATVGGGGALLRLIQAAASLAPADGAASLLSWTTSVSSAAIVLPATSAGH
jgi:autotransporter passenger strand-loop-strand repeat protein